MKRLLCIVSSMDRGGAETFLMKIYRQLDKTKYQMDFCVSKEKNGFYDNEIKTMGGKIFYVPPKSKKPIKNFLEIKEIVKKEKYNSVLRTSQQSLAALDLLAAKCGGANNLIYRSSNAGLNGNIFSRILNNFFSFLPRSIPNIKLAPSTEAAEFVFGKKSVENGKVYILHNAINYDDFKFNLKVRSKVRKELNIDEKVVYGHIGRFNIQKNHMFLLDVFNEIYKKNRNSVLLLIGNGELKNDILNKINTLKLNDSVFLLGLQDNVSNYLMAMDKFIFPSLFEGMPNVIIEAQASGLPCYISNTITKEANITGLVKYISLNDSSKEWASIILKDKINLREDYRKEFIDNNYDIERIANIFSDRCFR